MKKVSIVGVPEHFNLPWHLAIEEGAFEERGIDLQWKNIPEGTGKMCQLLKDNTADLAIILTEGITKSITEGNSVKIIQEYISTPLQWGVHVAADSPYHTLNDLKGTTAAISRYGSGSHLMSFVQAKNMGWATHDLKFSITHTLEGAIESLKSKEADYFMWEHFTTKPLVDIGIFKRLGDCPTPWPCFVIAGTDSFLNENKTVVAHILEIINTYTTDFKNIPSIDRTLANRYHQKLEDIQEWLSITQWSQSQLTKKTLTKVQETLLALDLIATVLPVTKFLYS